MLSRRLVLISLLFLGLACLAALPSTGQTTGAAKTPLTNQDVTELQRAGISADVMVAKIKAGPCNFDTSAQALKDLKAAGVPNNVILAMVESTIGSSSPSANDSGRSPVASDAAVHVRVYRQHRYENYELINPIYVDDQQVTRIGNGRRCSIKLTPGTHTIRSDDKSSSISIDAKPGQEFYVRVDEAVGFWTGHGKLTMMAPEQGKPEYKLQKPVEDDRRLVKGLIDQEDTDK